LQKFFINLIVSLVFVSFAFAKVVLEADQIVKTSKDSIKAEGSVVVKVDDKVTIKTSKLIYNKNKEKLIFPDKVVVTSKDFLIEAEKGWYNIKEEKGEFINAKLSINNQYFLQAKKLIKDGDFIFYEGGKFSTCPFDQYDWYFYSTSGKGKKNDYLYAKNVIFNFCYVPFIYIPYFVYPTSKRKSGILPVVIGQDIYNSYVIQIPLYWVINKTSDATITLDYREKQGKGASLEYRKRFTRESDIKLYTYYFKDNLLDEIWSGREITKKDRWLFKLNTNIEKFNDTKVFFYVELPSDRYFYEDLYSISSFGIEGLVRNRYRSFTKSQFMSVTNKEDFILEVNFEYLYDLTVEDNDITLQRLPEVRFYWKERPLVENLGIYYDFLSVNTYFYREIGLSGFRSDNTVRLVSSFNFDGFVHFLEVIPRSTIYAGLKEFTQSSASRNIISVKDRLSYPLYKNYSNFSHSIIPVVSFTYTQRVNQEDLPLFDKEDRILPQKDIDVSIFNIIETDDGKFFRWEVSTGYTFLDEFYIGDTMYEGSKKPLRNSLIFDFRFLSGENTLFYDQKLKQIVRSVSSLSVNFFNLLRYSVSHSYDKGEDETQNQIIHSVSTAYKILKLSGTVVSNIEKGYTQQKRVSLTLDRRCWSLTLNYLEDYNLASDNTFRTVNVSLNIFKFRYALPFLSSQ